MPVGPLVYLQAYLTQVCCHKSQHVEQGHPLIRIPNNNIWCYSTGNYNNILTLFYLQLVPKQKHAG